MKTAQHLNKVAKNWLKDGVYRQMERYAENGLFECRIQLIRATSIEIENLLLDLENQGFKYWWDSKPILVVSWADAGSPEPDRLPDSPASEF